MGGNSKSEYLQAPPDGGWGWLIVTGGMYCLAMWGGVVRCYSVFFAPMMAEFGVEYAQVAWLNGFFQISYGMFTTIGPLLMRTFDRRWLSLFASILCGFSCFVASFCQQLWAVQIFMGMIVGCCFGIVSISMFTTTTRYFEKRLHTANQLLCLGISAGPLLVCPWYQYLVMEYGWRGACRIVAGLFLNMALASALLRPIKLQSDLSDQELLTNNKEECLESSKEKKAKPKFFDLRSMDAEIVGSQSIGLYTPTLTRKRYDSNDNIVKEYEKAELSLPDYDDDDDVGDGGNKEKETFREKFVKFCRKYDLTLFADKRFYLYALSWTSFAAAFFSASTYIIPYGEKVLKLSEFEASTLVSAFAGGELFSRVMYAFFFDRIPLNYRILYVSVLYAFLTVAIFILPFMHSYVGAMICCAFIGALGGGTDGIYSAFIAEIFSVKQYAYVFGYGNTIIHSTGTATTVLVGVVVDKFKDLSASFYIGCGAAALSSLLVFLLHKTVIKARKENAMKEEANEIVTS